MNMILREISQEDIEIIRNWRNSKEVSKYMYTDDYITREAQLDWFRTVSNSPNCKYFMICYDNKDLGVANLSNIDYRNKHAFWGFYLGDNSVRGKGIGYIAEFKVLSYAFDVLNLNKLLGEVFATNANVLNLHEKFGFKKEGYRREHVFKHGEFHDVVSIAMLKSEWESIKGYHEQIILSKYR